MSLHRVSLSRYPGASIKIPNDLPRHYRLGRNVLHRKAKSINKAFRRYVDRQNQHRPDQKRPIIQVLSCQYDPGNALHLDTDQNIYAVTDLAEFGFVQHAPISSMQALDRHLDSHVDTIVIKGHGGILKEKGTGRLKHQIALREDRRFNLSGVLLMLLNTFLNWLFRGSVVTFSADSLSTHANPDLKSIILDTCSGGKVILPKGKDRRPTGMALDLAHRYPGVAVTGAIRMINHQTRFQYLRSVEGRLEASIRVRQKEVGRTFCVDPNKNYRSVDDLKRAADTLEMSEELSDHAEFKHLLDHTKLTFEELQEVHDYCVNGSYWACLSVFEKAPWYRSFAKLTVAVPVPTEPL